MENNALKVEGNLKLAKEDNSTNNCLKIGRQKSKSNIYNVTCENFYMDGLKAAAKNNNESANKAQLSDYLLNLLEKSQKALTQIIEETEKEIAKLDNEILNLQNHESKIEHFTNTYEYGYLDCDEFKKKNIFRNDSICIFLFSIN